MMQRILVLIGLLCLVGFIGFFRAAQENEYLIDSEIVGALQPVTIDLSPSVCADSPPPVRRYFAFAFDCPTEICVEIGGFRVPTQLDCRRIVEDGTVSSHLERRSLEWCGTQPGYGYKRLAHKRRLKRIELFIL